MKFIGRLFRWLNLLVVGGTILAFLAPYISPSLLWPISFFGLALPVFLLLNIIFIVVFYLLKEKKGWYLNAMCLAISVLFIGKIIGFNSHSNNNENSLKVLSFNAQSFSKFNYTQYKTLNKTDIALEKSMSDYKDILANNDILCLQEASPFIKHEFANYINKVFGLTYAHESKLGLKIFSAFPIINKGVLIDKGGNGCIFVDIKFDTSIVRIYNYHLQSTGIAPDAQKVINNPDFEDDNTKETVKNIAIRLKNGNINRAKDVEIIKQHMESCPYPIIACGDLNDTPFTYSYNTLRDGLKDSFVERGSGFGATYNGPIPFLRIDYIMTSPQFEIYSHKLLDTQLSDHYPIVSEIGF